MKFKIASLAALVLVVLLQSAAPADEFWTDDIAAAIKRAEKEKKDLLLNFTGSDWCKFCIQLESEVFGVDGFSEKASKNFILVTVDFPQDKSGQSERVIRQNEDWQKRFAIDGYPTIVLLDRDQRPYAFTGYQQGGVDAYLENLETLHQARVRRDEAFAKAEKAEGVERAKLLDEGLSALEENVVEVYYEDVIKEIVELDSENEAGLRAKYNEARERELQRALMTDIAMVARLQSPQVAIKFIDEAVAAIPLSPMGKYQVLLIKLDLLRKIKDYDGAEALIDEMMALEGLTSVDVQKLIAKRVFLMVGAGRRDAAVKLLDEKIASMEEVEFLNMAKGELLDADGKFEEAISSYDAAINSPNTTEELMSELVGAKADALCELDKSEEAVKLLDTFAENENWPQDLRGEAYVHKAMILREQGRRRAAILSENKAVEVVENPREKAQMQKLVDQLRRKFDK